MTTRPAGGCCSGEESPRLSPAVGGVRPAAGPPPPKGGTVVGLAAGQPAPDGPVRAPRRPLGGVPASGLRPQALTVVNPPLTDAAEKLIPLPSAPIP
jgi:hypothetical protein